MGVVIIKRKKFHQWRLPVLGNWLEGVWVMVFSLCSLYLLLFFFFFFCVFQNKHVSFSPEVLWNKKTKKTKKWRFAFKYTILICSCLGNSMMMDWLAGGWNVITGRCLFAWVGAERRPHGSSLWASILSFRSRIPFSTEGLPPCFVSINSLILSISEKWIVNSQWLHAFQSSSTSPGYKCWDFQQFCLSKISNHLYLECLKACGFLSLSAAAECLSWAEIKQRQGFLLAWSMGQIWLKRLGLWQWSSWNWYLNARKGRKEDSINSTNP